MRYLILFLLSFPVYAAEAIWNTVNSEGFFEVILTDKPCTNGKILKRLEAMDTSMFFAGTYSHNEAKEAMCWTLFPSTGIVAWQFEEDFHASLPIQLFVPIPEVHI